MMSVFPRTVASTVSRNWRTLSAAEPVLFGLRLMDAMVTLRGAGGATWSREMSSHQTVAWGAFER